MPVTGASRKTPGIFWDNGGAVINAMHPDYGVIANGVANDSTALNAAIAAAGTLGGGKVVFPAGTYLAGITVSAPDVHLVLRPGAILRTPSASTHAITLASTAHRAGIFGGRIEGVATSNATTQWGIFTASQAAPNDVTVKGVTFSGADASHGLNNGVLVDGLGVSGVGLRWTLTRNRVERGTASSCRARGRPP
jgi:polygalacturonase